MHLEEHQNVQLVSQSKCVRTEEWNSEIIPFEGEPKRFREWNKQNKMTKKDKMSGETEKEMKEM